MPPRPSKPKAASKPKPTPKTKGPSPDFVIDESESSRASGRNPSIAPHKHFVRFWKFWLRLGKTERFAIIAALFLIFGASAIGWYYFIQPKPEPSLIIVKHAKPKPKPPETVASPLTGIQVTPEMANRPVTGVMIENSIYARPQSGLQEAGVVFEAIAEGGITRFMALFQEGQPLYVGPVRSLRPYYIDFAAPFQASIAHVGGSPEALARVRNGTYRDVDQFFNSRFYYRVPYRPAPHNVYTGFDKLNALNQSKGYTSSLFTSWPRKPDSKLSLPTARTIDMAISRPDYYARYNYDAASNTYLRSVGGQPHMELVSPTDKTGVQIQPKVVISLVVPYSIARNGQYSVYGTVGSGTAYIFQDGGVTTCTWIKSDANSQITFKDDKDLPVKLNAGQTWITLVASANKITYQP